jgi:outer membrane immunogenic protein
MFNTTGNIMKQMRAGLVGLAIVCAALLPGTAANADGYRGSIKDAPMAFSWTGVYIGGHAGLVTGETTGDVGLGGPLNTDFSLSGALYGGQVGYNWQSGATVLGLEGSFSGANVQGTTACVAILECKRDLDWVATVVGRAGIAIDRSLLYAMGGVAWADVGTKVSIVGVPLLSGSDTHVGWVAGFGFEHSFTDRISTRIEYAHIDLGDQNTGLVPVGGGPAVVTDKVDVRMDTIRLGVNIKLTN